MERDWIHRLTIIFWVIVGVVLVSVILAFVYCHGLTIVNDQSDRTIGETISILTMLLGIPLSIKLYHVYTKEKMPKNLDKDELVKKISKWFLLRIAVITTALFLNFIAYVLFGSSSAFLCVVICLVFLCFFCRPNRQDLTDLLQNSQKEESCE